MKAWRRPRATGREPQPRALAASLDRSPGRAPRLRTPWPRAPAWSSGGVLASRCLPLRSASLVSAGRPGGGGGGHRSWRRLARWPRRPGGAWEGVEAEESRWPRRPGGAWEGVGAEE